jgi:nicotinate-nucleotide adenylyltransferase
VRRLGLLGGTFDPVHNGHLMIAEEARQRFHLEEVRFIPAGQPPHKHGRPVTPAHDRLAMVRLAIADKPAFTVSSMEIERAGLSYTVDTLIQVRREEGPNCELYFIVGGDALPDLLSWRTPERVLELCVLVAFRRPAVAPLDLEKLRARLPAAAEKVLTVAGPQFAVSGTEIRRRVHAGLPVGELVPPAVVSYIESHALYR